MKPYRKNVGVVVFNREGRVLLGERLNQRGAWQFPQGGIDRGETTLEAGRRELYEETGLLLSDPPAAEIADWLYYDFPKEMKTGLTSKHRGQQQKWYFYHWDGDHQKLDLAIHKREFAQLTWGTLEEAAAGIVAFKKKIYEQIRDEGGPLIKAYLKKLA